MNTNRCSLCQKKAVIGSLATINSCICFRLGMSYYVSRQPRLDNGKMVDHMLVNNFIIPLKACMSALIDECITLNDRWMMLVAFDYGR